MVCGENLYAFIGVNRYALSYHLHKKKDDLIEYLDELRFMLKDPNIHIIQVDNSIIPVHKDVMVGEKKIGTVPVTKEYNIKFTIRA